MEEALASIPWPWGYMAIGLVLLVGLFTYLQKRHKFLSDVRLGLVFLSVLVDLFTGRPKTFVNCFNVRLCGCRSQEQQHRVWKKDGRRVDGTKGMPPQSST